MDVNPSSADLLLKPILHSICIDQIKLLIQDAATSSAVAIIVDELPKEVGVDPYNKLIDTNSEDNRMKL